MGVKQMYPGGVTMKNVKRKMLVRVIGGAVYFGVKRLLENEYESVLLQYSPTILQIWGDNDVLCYSQLHFELLWHVVLGFWRGVYDT